jgi:tetratricopeptide (TPR) repeat protein
VEFRIMGLNDPRGLATSSEKSECIEILEKALGETLGIWGDPVATLDEALEIDPTFVMGHVFRAEMQLTAMERSLLPSVARDIELAEALTGNANERERLHIAAARAWLEGDIDDARNRYEEILLRYPLDLCALSTVHMADFYMGNSIEMRDRVARARRAWHEDLPGYGYVLGIHAFGMEECGDYGAAEDLARQAVEINPRDTYAIHAVAHIMEMCGRQRDGIAWMMDRKDDWAGSNFAIHLRQGPRDLRHRHTQQTLRHLAGGAGRRGHALAAEPHRGRCRGPLEGVGRQVGTERRGHPLRLQRHACHDDLRRRRPRYRRRHAPGRRRQLRDRARQNQSPHDQGGRHAHLPGDPGLQPRRL